MEMAGIRMATQASTHTPTVMVVEDEFIIALDLSETVADLGLRCEGPFSTNSGALKALADEMPDCAILDVMIGDGEVFPVADALTSAGVPIIFHSGHVPPEEVRTRYPEAIACSKPCPPDQLIAMVTQALQAHPTNNH